MADSVAKTQTEGMLLPVTSVTSVTVVTEEEGNKSNNSNEGNREQNPFHLDSSFTTGKGEKERLAALYFNNPRGLVDAQAAELLNIARESIKAYRQRLGDHVVPVGDERPQRFALSPLGRAKVEKEYWEWRKSIDDATRRTIALEEANKCLSMQCLDITQQIEKWREFFEIEPHMSRLHSQVRNGSNWIQVDFGDVAKHSPELANMLLDVPGEVLKAGQIAIEKMNIPSNADDFLKVEIRVTNLPAHLSVGALETRNLKKLVSTEAQVVTVGERRSEIITARFECPSCGNVLCVLQDGQKFKEPTRCACGRKGKFRVLGKDMVDAASMLLQQPVIELAGKSLRPSTLRVRLHRDLTSPMVRDQLGINRIVRVTGILEEVPIISKTGGQSTRVDWQLDANSIEVVEHYNPDLRLTPTRIEEIRREAQRSDFVERFRRSFFPQHVGDEALKDVLMCQAVAMPLHLHTQDAWEQASRESLHVLIMTPPGMGKSKNLAGRMLELVPIKGRANGTGATRAGLTIGADQKDKETDLVIPSPQALPGANLGLFVLDEADKMKLEEQPVLNEAMSEHTVTVAKRGVNLTLPAMVCSLLLANPKTYDWNLQEDTLETTLNLHYTTLTRCYVWVGFDKADQQHDEDVALAILRRTAQKDKPYSDEFVRDYILYARAKLAPRMLPEHEALLAKVYGALRQMQTRKYLGPRYVEQARALVLLHAKLHLREETTLEDLKWADDLLVRQLTSIGFDPNRLTNTIPRMVQQ